MGDSTSEVGSDDESEGRAAKRRRLNEEEIDKRREKRLWEENRSKLLFEYAQFTYYAKAVSLIQLISTSHIIFLVLECNTHV